MAHTCPECDALCRCGGDIDDICMDYGPEQDRCTHWKQCDNSDDDEELDDFDDELAIWDGTFSTQEYKWKKTHPRRFNLAGRQRRYKKYERRSRVFSTIFHGTYKVRIFSKKSMPLAARLFGDNDLPF